jgi:hypothetical protein
MLGAEEAIGDPGLSWQGKIIRELARRIGMPRNTVRYFRNERLPRYQPEPQPTNSTPTSLSSRSRVKAAAPERTPATVLVRELRTQGHAGGYSVLTEHLRPHGPNGEARIRGLASRPSRDGRCGPTSGLSARDATNVRCSSQRWSAARLTSSS